MVKAEGTYLLATGSDTDWTTVLSDWDFTFSLLADSIHDISGLPLQDNVSLIRNTNFTKIDISANSPSLRPFRAYMVDISGLIDDYTKFYMTEDASGKIHDIYVDDILGKTSYDTDICANQIKAVTMAQAVTSIAERAFYALPELKWANIPKTVTEIGSHAFYDCSNLSGATFEAGSQLTSIGEYVFRGASSLTSISIPSTVVNIGQQVFYKCSNLSSVTFEAGSQLTSIGSNAFYLASSLRSISIPSTVVSIGRGAFTSSGVTSVTFAPDSQLLSIEENTFRNSALTSIVIPASVTSIGQQAFQPMDGNTSSLTSVTFEANSQLTSIGSSAFRGVSDLISITIPPLVTSIGQQAFIDCSNLSHVTFTGDMIPPYISSNTFPPKSQDITAYYTQDLSPNDIDILEATFQYVHGPPKTLFTLKNNNFKVIDISGSLSHSSYSNDISLNDIISVMVGTDVTSIGNAAFYQATNLTSVTIPNSVITIEDFAFGLSGLTSVTIPASVTSMGYSVFAAPKLTSVTFEPNSQLTKIEYGLFQGTGLSSIVIPASIVTIVEGAFSLTPKLTSVTFEPNSQLTSIGEQAFEGASSLTSITIPSGVTTIGQDAFVDSSLNTVYMTEPTSVQLGLPTWYNYSISPPVGPDGQQPDNVLDVSGLNNYSFFGATVNIYNPESII